MCFRGKLVAFVLWTFALCSLKAQKPLPQSRDKGIICLTGYGKTPAVLAENTGISASAWRLIDLQSGIWLVQSDVETEDILLAKARRSKLVLAAQKRFNVQRRAVPDDPLYANQNYLKTIAMPALWDKGKGGLNVLGDTMVMAIIDDGMDTIHPDLLPNMWFNRNEIPFNGIDDDQNGYVDDYRGWNGGDQNNKTFTSQSLSAHGTGIAGVVGSAGNNGIGVTGINWKIKILPVLCYTLNGVDSDLGVIRSMIYVLRMKQLYMQTNGEKGAMIATLNTSVGIDRAFPDEQPVWCALYDSLGTEGIVSSIATSNNNVDIAVAGDIPSLCPSKYTLVVSNMTSDDMRIGSGYNTTHVDLAAPGQKVYTTDLSTGGGANGPYREHSGTSFAAPQVGAVAALVQTLACDSFWALHKKNPDSAARLVKSWVMTGTDALMVLTDKCASGGRLNAYKTWQKMTSWCNSVQPGFGSLELKSAEFRIYPNPASVNQVINLDLNVPVQSYELTDLTGRIIDSGIVEGREIRLKSAVQGAYYLKLKTQQGIILKTKLLIQ